MGRTGLVSEDDGKAELFTGAGVATGDIICAGPEFRAGPEAVSEGSDVFSSLLESSSNTDFLDKSCCAIAEGWDGRISRLSLED